MCIRDRDEAEIVRLIFRKYVDEGYGAQRLCKYLHESGIHSRDGKGFPNTTINRIIKNVMYTGIIKNGDSRSAYLEELRIIDDATFDLSLIHILPGLVRFVVGTICSHLASLLAKTPRMKTSSP